jgi:type VI secretion system Hcp family effector
MRKLSGTWAGVLGTGLVAAMLFPAAARAAIDTFIQIEGVTGESTAPGHRGWVEIQSFDTSRLDARAAGEREGRTVSHEPLVITREVDASSPKLRAFCASGKHLPTIEVDVVSDGRTRHYHLENVIVSSYTMRKAGGQQIEEITFTFGKITAS